MMRGLTSAMGQKPTSEIAAPKSAGGHFRKGWVCANEPTRRLTLDLFHIVRLEISSYHAVNPCVERKSYKLQHGGPHAA